VEGWKRPGWLTSEHLLTWAAIVLSALEANGVFSDTTSHTQNMVAAALTVLASLGYTASRSYLKVQTAPVVHTVDPDKLVQAASILGGVIGPLMHPPPSTVAPSTIVPPFPPKPGAAQ
jgi:hypothetical protein